MPLPGFRCPGVFGGNMHVPVGTGGPQFDIARIHHPIANGSAMRRAFEAGPATPEETVGVQPGGVRVGLSLDDLNLANNSCHTCTTPIHQQVAKESWLARYLQSSSGEDANNGQFHLFRQMQAPNHWNRHEQNQEVGNDIEIPAGHGDVDERHATSFGQWVPQFVDRNARKDDKKGVRYRVHRPQRGDGVDSPSKTLVDAKHAVEKDED
ncbi:MAG: hypothetical protein Q9216_005821 [Gyalolechia sp. 2 TL-2023]